MGCTGSALRCCPVGAERQLKAQQQRGSASQELSALKTQNANASLLPEHGEKAAWPEEWTESARFLQGQEEEDERLRDAGQAGTASVSQDTEVQVEKGKELELKEQLDALRKEHTETLQELQGAHEQEKLLLTESHHRTEAALQEKIQELNSQLKSFQERMKRVEESLLRTDYKKHIQEHGSPSPFWEQELESLHFVIEMKNEQIHVLDKKLLHLETVEERNLVLEEKVKTLQQENEDLQVRTQNHLVVARQLSEELRSARGALEKEAQLLDQARREKEELLYRVLNAGDGTPFPLATGEVSLIATLHRRHGDCRGCPGSPGLLPPVPPGRGRAPGWPSPRGVSRTAVMEHFTDAYACISPARVGLERDPGLPPTQSLRPFLW